jgi:hypothetical protein
MSFKPFFVFVIILLFFSNSVCLFQIPSNDLKNTIPSKNNIIDNQNIHFTSNLTSIFYSSVSGSGTFCSSSSPCSLEEGINKIYSTPNSLLYVNSGHYTISNHPDYFMDNPGFNISGWLSAHGGSVNSSYISSYPSICCENSTSPYIFWFSYSITATLNYIHWMFCESGSSQQVLFASLYFFLFNYVH